MADRNEGVHLASNGGVPYWFLGTRMTVKADGAMTGGRFSMTEFTAPYGFGPPRHVHPEQDEAFIIVQGRIRVSCGEQDEWDAGPGSFVYLPRKVPHAFVVTSREPVVGWALCAPSGFEGLVAEVGEPATGPGLPAPVELDVARVADASARHGSEILGPPMRP